MGKEKKSRKTGKKVIRWNRSFVVLAAIVLLVLGAVGTTLAWLTDATDAIVNKFEYTEVKCEVQEEFDGLEKKNVKVTNTGSTDAYIRATYVVTFRDAEGNIVYGTPKEGIDYTIKLNNTNIWVYEDGYYYYGAQVDPNGETQNLIERFKGINTEKWPAGCHLSVEILASAVQANQKDAMGEAWGYIWDNTVLTKYTTGN